MAVVNKPDMNYGTWAENGNIEIPSSEKVEEGWVIEKPLNEHMNWVQNRQDKMLQYLNQRGMAEWDFRTEYPKDAFTVRSGLMYRAASPNIDSDPLTNPEIWTQPFALSGVADDVGEEVKKIKNNDGYLTHYVRKKAPVMTAIALGVGYADSTGASGLRFNGTKAYMTYQGKTVAEFTGGQNANDVVTHQQLGAKLQGYLIGDIYITTASGDPRTRFGYGTWERYAEGEVLVGFSTSVSNSVPQWVKTIGSKFGSYFHKLTVEEMPSHVHDVTVFPDKNGHDSSDEGDRGVKGKGTPMKDAITPTGGDEPHNNVQPSIVVYMWKRIA